jgi:hypothetical protein
MNQASLLARPLPSAHCLLLTDLVPPQGFEPRTNRL